MPIITISRGSYSRGKEVAELLAARLDYHCVSRDIILETCSEFNIPELKLVRALHDPSSVLERFRHGKERYLSCYRYAMLNSLQQDNIVYHGLAGHFLLRDIPHVLKVRITADLETRVAEEMKRENISAEQALYTLKKDDEERRRWGLQIHGADTWDSRLYDIVLHIGTLTVDDAVDILAEVAKKPAFRATAESAQLMQNMLTAARIHTRLVEYSPQVRVRVDQGVATISNADTKLKSDQKLRQTVEKLALDVEGIHTVTFNEPLTSNTGYINPYHNI